MPKEKNRKSEEVSVKSLAALAKKWGARFSTKELKDIKNYKDRS